MSLFLFCILHPSPIFRIIYFPRLSLSRACLFCHSMLTFTSLNEPQTEFIAIVFSTAQLLCSLTTVQSQPFIHRRAWFASLFRGKPYTHGLKYKKAVTTAAISSGMVYFRNLHHRNAIMLGSMDEVGRLERCIQRCDDARASEDTVTQRWRGHVLSRSYLKEMRSTQMAANSSAYSRPGM
jgi:hypothetical protein